MAVSKQCIKTSLMHLNRNKTTLKYVLINQSIHLKSKYEIVDVWFSYVLVRNKA